jgi:protein-tyrosine phosphatase
MSPKRIEPEVGVCRVAIERISVDLPAPFGPSRPNMPFSTVRLTSSSARVPLPYNVSQVFDRQHDIRNSDLSARAFTDYMVDYYRDAPFVDRHVDLYSRYFHALSETDGAVLIHCAAGKDRTGILAALTHHLAGVSEEDIVADFLLTNDPHRFERRAPQFAAMLEEMTGRRPTQEAVFTALGVESHYLETAFAAIHEQHGTLDAYLRDVLGVDDARREAIAHKILD